MWTRDMIPVADYRRAQRNLYGFQYLLLIPRGERYDMKYRTGLDVDTRLWQEYIYSQIGQTWHILPTSVIYLPISAAQITSWDDGFNWNIYLYLKDYLKSVPVRFDSSGKQTIGTIQPGRIDMCNPYRVYMFAVVGDIPMKSMAGRQDFSCEQLDKSINPLEPWGPGRGGGPSGWAIQRVRGNNVPVPKDLNIGGATPRAAACWRAMHEAGHCIGCNAPDGGPHCNPDLIPDAGSCPWNTWGGDTWGTWPELNPAMKICSYHKQHLLDSHFTS